MRNKRVLILLPQDLVKEIDWIVGPKGRSAFLIETAREAVRRKKALRFLESDTPVGKDADHPELGRSAAELVRELRQESERKRTSKTAARHKRFSSGTNRGPRLFFADCEFVDL